MTLLSFVKVVSIYTQSTTFLLQKQVLYCQNAPIFFLAISASEQLRTFHDFVLDVPVIGEVDAALEALCEVSPLVGVISRAVYDDGVELEAGPEAAGTEQFAAAGGCRARRLPAQSAP